ncbi:sialate O-acetylesterase [Spirosoma aerolatum]|uniref:sialate O-acetylesterase n=1 Tax=Spirosoma aerolatum TaxID=1211326 RepID=UPI0009AE820A|nr:sialate O-acetylesterase [Spirosoma aerolatum]
MPSFIKWFLLLIFCPLLAVAQLQITHPMARFVVQRGLDGNGRLYIAGRFTGTVDRVEAQLTPAVAGQGTATSWQTVQTSPTNNIFLGYVTGAGGWYVLTVRTIVNNIVVAQASVQPVGIGEIFVSAGQSNSRGLGIGDNDLGSFTDRVSTIDSINHYYPPGAQALYSSGDPLPVPVYKPLTAGRRIFPMAESSWCWGELGDYIVNRYNVPVAFYITGWDSSTVENWINSANGIPACNRYWCVENWPNLQPYTNLKNVMNYYLSMAGVRAILWHQGEAEYGDANSGSIPAYATNLTNLIQKSRQDFGGRNLSWMVARVSFDGDPVNPVRQPVIDKQLQVINTPGLNVFQGPLTDTIPLRNAGENGGHFRNIQRPSPNPQYYLNTGSIPTNMGLSHLARNWNNSLNTSFFQNAQPIMPTQFAVTGNLANTVLPGATVSVSFATLGTFNGGNQWQVQLLDSLGQYKSVLGNGATSPIQVTLPSSLTSGYYRIRVVASSPAIPAVPSNIFQITTQTQADVSLSMAISSRSASVSTPVTFSLAVRNDGPGQATNVVIRNRLPTNLAFVSSADFSVSSGVLTSSAINLAMGATQTFRFVAQPTAAGYYQNAAEIAQATSTDPDSQPNSGTGDGQDDAAQVDFRTIQPSASLFASPNPNQVPLPTVISSQPTPDPNKADISIRLVTNTRTPVINEIISYSLIITNQGGLSASGLSVAATLPAGQTFVSGDDFGTSGGNLVSGVSSLAAGSSVTLIFRSRATASGTGICRAQLTASSVADPDSTPNNGTTNGEDDTTQVDVRVR